MTELQKGLISNTLVIIAMMLLVAALGLGSGTGIVLSFIAIFIASGAVIVSMIENCQVDSEDSGDQSK